MRDKNFDSIKNFNVPENWVENALNIPQSERKSPVAFIKFSRTLSAVASLVLVCALSVAVFFYTQKNDIVVPENNVVESESATQATKSSTSDSSTQGSSNVEKPTDKHSVILPDGFIRPTGVINIPTNGEIIKPTEHTKPSIPSQRPTYPNVEPSEATTEPENPPTVNPQPSEPITPPTYPLPTDPEPSCPLPTAPNPTSKPVIPTESDTVAPTYNPIETECPTEPAAGNECRVMISKEDIVGSGNIYCAVVRKDDGSSTNPEKHLAIKVIEYSDSVMYVYFPDDYNQIKKTGYYLCYFYNEDGTLVKVKEEYFYSYY